jgi:hypothetical protein
MAERSWMAASTVDSRWGCINEIAIKCDTDALLGFCHTQQMHGFFGC